MKKCSKCGEIKSLGSFAKRESNRDGRRYCCRECTSIRVKNNKISKIIKALGKLPSFQECVDLSEGLSAPEFKLKFPYHYSCMLVNSWKIKIFGYVGRVKYSEAQIISEGRKYSSPKEFKANSPNHYAAAMGRKILDKSQSHMTDIRRRKSEFECETVISQYSTLQDFYTDHWAMYQTVLKHYRHLLESLEHGDCCLSGVKRSGFIKYCEENNEGYGTFYVIRLFNDGESFYKYGITGKTVEARHALKYQNVYDYEVIMEFEVPANFCWDLEQHYKSLTEFRYLPEQWFKGFSECFKCHGNCKILNPSYLNCDSVCP